MNVFASKDDCKSWLGKKIQQWRAGRPSEWMVDEFIREVEKSDKALKAAKAFIECHAADPDITEEMRKTYSEYEQAIEELHSDYWDN